MSDVIVDHYTIVQDNTTLSEKSSAMIVAECATCGNQWETRKRELFHHRTSCSQCYPSQKRPSENLTLEKYPILATQGMVTFGSSVPSNTRKSLTFTCNTCSMVSTRKCSTIIDMLSRGQHPCGNCHPIPRVRSGLLFVENYPDVKENLLVEQPEGINVATHREYPYRMSCGHVEMLRPQRIINNIDSVCRECHKKNNQVKVDGQYYQPQEKVTTLCVTCGGKFTDVAHKLKNTVSCPRCRRSQPLSGKYLNGNTWENIMWSRKNAFPLESFSVSSSKKVTLECRHGHTWNIPVYAIKDSCPLCSGSSGENELRGAVEALVGEDKVVARSRSIIPPCELDIYVPDKNIAIEYNGLYWHTESAGRDRNYHYNKWKECREQGIQLIMIWEDEWRDNRELVEKMLSHKLGVSNEQKVFARKTRIVQVESSVVREFCDTNHIQGSANGSVYFGLKDDSGELVAVSVWRKNRNTLYLERYCTSTTVVGGMGKLLKAGKTWARNNDCYRIVTFADHQVSDGNLYEKLGFVAEKEIKPDYKYVVGGKRKHKFGYRLKRFQNDPELLYREGYTETQLAQLNGLERVWDCGKTRYVIGLM